MRLRLAALLLALLASAASAQNVTVIGPVTPGHGAAFNSTTVIKDSGFVAGAASVNWINVKQAPCNAVGDGVADDTAAINTCIANFNTATKGTLYFPAGTYKTTTALTAITANGIIRGDGPSNLTEQLSGAVVPATQINNTTTNAAVFTINSQQVMVRDLSIKNTAGSTPTAGSVGIGVSSGTEYNNKVDMENITVTGFNIDVDRQTGALWVMHNVGIVDPVQYGLRINNTVNLDAGDWSISNSYFYTGVNAGTDAIRVDGSGGGKIVNIKINCNVGCTNMYTNGIEIIGHSATSDMMISNSSIENFSGTGIKIDGSTGTWPNIVIDGIQFNNGPTLPAVRCITASNNLRMSISNLVTTGFAGAACIQLTSMTDVTVGPWQGASGQITGGAPAISQTANVSAIGTIFGQGLNTLIQGFLTQENRNPTGDSYTQWVLGNSFLGGGSPTATNFAGFMGGANHFFTGTAQKDWINEISGGGAWWLDFNSDPTHGGTETIGLKVQAIAAGATSLTTFSGGTGASPAAPIGWFNYGGQQRVTADVPFTSTTTPALVTGLQETVIAGRNYSFDAYLSWTDAAAGGIQCTINGTATATAIRYDGWIIDSAANGIKGNAAATALGGVVASAVTTGTNGVVQIKGTMTVNAGGTMEVRCAQNTSNATATTIKQGSYWLVQDMP